jgi:transposase
MHRHALTNEEWEKIEPFMTGKASDPGATATDNRRFIDAVLWIAKTGAPWRDLPERLGQWDTQYTRFNRWAKAGRWQQIFEALAVEVDEEFLMIDSTIVRAHQHAAGAKGGR